MSAQPQVHTKVTRQDWIDAAVAALDNEAIDRLRVLSLARRLSVSRSSYYWYFEDPDDLRSELLLVWERNTTSIVERAERDAGSIVSACLGVFECWADAQLYQPSLDLSMRDWGRRDESVARRVTNADDLRLEALTAMFGRFGFDSDEAVVRARLLYHSQVGYYALGTDEPMSARLSCLPYYLEAMTGSRPTRTELDDFEAVVSNVM